MFNIKTYGGKKKKGILQELELLGEILTNWVYQSRIDILVILQLLYQMQEINKLSKKKAFWTTNDRDCCPQLVGCYGQSIWVSVCWWKGITSL